MSETPDIPLDPKAPKAPTAPTPTAARSSAAAAVASPRRTWAGLPRAAVWPLTFAVLAIALAAAAIALAWSGQQRLQRLEQELVRRQHDSATQAAQARLLADQSQGLAREAVAKATLLETRVAEISMQRGELDELIKSMSRSRDENLVADIDAGIRVSLQQTAITGSAAPLVAALKAADERLQRVSEPRLEAARRAIARDLDRVKAASVADIATLSIKIDEAVRLVDEMPLLVIDSSALAGRVAVSAPDASASTAAPPSGAKPARSSAQPAAAASAAPAPADSGGGWLARWSPALLQSARDGWHGLASEVRGLLRVTRIDQPQAMLLAPEQSYFLRENLKLRLLNARLALLSRQFDTAQSDLQMAIAAIEEQFDRNARRTQVALELLRGVRMQARQSAVPRPDETLSVLAAAAAGR